ncbi:MAG: RHS repeat protein, partial [Thermoanaerobaculia bacterium]|nr:RHS repeat protein [Thermoanaerobaculia bacterium]
MTGDALVETEEGFEGGVPFAYSTVTTYNSAGMPLTIDRPGFGIDDMVTMTYDSARGELVMLSRSEPLIGTTTYQPDAFNRTEAVIDVNGVVTETIFDPLDRTRFTIQRGATPAEDLITEHRYDPRGDLFQVVLPRGNVIEYGHDPARRLTTIERKPDDSPTSHGERVAYQLNGVGQQIREEQQRWEGSWVTKAATERVYANRCQLQEVILGAGSVSPSTTEYGYDCESNLTGVWDANHPSNNQTAPPSTRYFYDDLNRLTMVTQPWGGAGGGNVTTSYGYDVQDHLLQVTDGELGVTRYSFSDRDLLMEEESEVSGVSTYGYNPHGQLVMQQDARGVVVQRQVDELDRVTFLDYPDNALDVTYEYDDPLVPFSKGRLTKITRNGHEIAYGWDRWGRMEQDGALVYRLDANGNREEIEYPGGVIARYQHDYADREAALEVEVPGEPVQTVVSTASYLPAGPLEQLTLGNGLMETRLYDSRYFQDRITVAGSSTLLDWDYTVDPVGNPTAIADLLSPSQGRTYGYQDYQYYLRLGNGPWGNLSWTYDRIGNRLTETRGGVTDVYSYVPNLAGGRTAKLAQIQLGAGGTRVYGFDAAGNQSQVTQGAAVVTMTHDDANLLAALDRAAAGVGSDFLYDGRGFLRQAAEVEPDLLLRDGFETGDYACWSAVVGGTAGGVCPGPPQVGPVYSSEGQLHYQLKEGGIERIPLYFAGRPVATLTIPESGAVQWQFLAVDHLGTPTLATTTAGAISWVGGF